MKTVCAWCNKIIRSVPEGAASHGICEECEKVITEEIKRERHEREVRPFVEGQQRAREYKPPPQEFDWMAFPERPDAL